MGYQMAVEAHGKTYSSALIGGGRLNPRNRTVDHGPHVIDSPVFIIEDMLRTIGGVSDTAIDTDSFDNAESQLPAFFGNEPNQYRMQVALIKKEALAEGEDQRPTLKEVIQKICRESPYAFYFTAAGRARMLSMIARVLPEPEWVTIPLADIDRDSLSVGMTRGDRQINFAQIEWPLRPHDGVYSKVMTANYSGGQPFVRERNIKLEYVNNADTANHFRQWLFESLILFIWPHSFLALTGKFAIEPKLIVRFHTLGIKYAHLEIGDWIAFDADEMDREFMLAGESWQDVQLMIVGKYTTLERTEFTIIKPLIKATAAPRP